LIQRPTQLCNCIHRFLPTFSTFTLYLFLQSVDLQAAATQLDMSFTDFMTNSGHSEIRPPVGVTQSTTLEELFVKVALTKVHRVFVIDQNSEALMGVITLTDLLKLVNKLS